MALPMTAMTRLAWRNLWRNHRRTLIMLAAIGVGAWAMMFMSALMNGFMGSMVENSIRDLPGEVQIHHPSYRDDPNVQNSLAEPSGALLAALSDPLVTGWASRVRVPAMISSERDNRPVTLLGVHPTEEESLSFDTGNLVEGRWLEGPDDTGLVVGRKILARLETRLGKRVVVMSQDPDNNIADRGFRIVGVYKAALETQEEAFIYTGRQTAQAMLKIAGQVSEIGINGGDYRDVEPLLSLIQPAAPPDAEVLSWKQLNEFAEMMMEIMDAMAALFAFIIFLALSFGLANTLVMAVFERIREIGLMQALGMKPRSILLQILLESIMLLAIGMVCGTLVAVWSVYSLRDGIDLTAVQAGLELFGTDATLVPRLTLYDILLANGVVIVLGILASLLPAWRASRYKPVEALGKI